MAANGICSQAFCRRDGEKPHGNTERSGGQEGSRTWRRY